MKKTIITAAIGGLLTCLAAFAAEKPNILVIWGDDIGQSNISAYSRGMMGYKTPNIDRIAKEGILFTDYYGEQSCTAGRASFMLGQSVYRTGLSKVGLPGAPKGINVLDPTIAVLLKDQGYVTGQFGKNHFGDQDHMLPTNHGFDEFLGNLYHLNAEEEPENEDYPRDPEFKKKFGPRGVIKSSADGKIQDTGPLTKKRQETIDDETVAAAVDFIQRSHKSGKPWFCWWNGTRMHFRTHVKSEMRKQADEIAGKHLDEYQAGMVEHDIHIGVFMKLLDDLGIADNTIVMYSTDNGPHMNSWPDAASSPFENEKNSNGEGGWRVPCLIRWPGVIQPGSVSNGVVHHMDMMPTFLAAAGKTDIKEDLLDGYKSSALKRDYKIHLDGYDLSAHLKDPDNVESPRKEVFYFSDTGELTALRYADWKMVFLEQKTKGGLRVWIDPWVELRCPLIFNLRRDPYERAQFTSNTYYDWMMDRIFLLVPAQQYVGKFLSTFKEYPPRMKPASFSIDQVMQKMTDSASSKGK